MTTRHLVLAGDSIFDNDGYVMGEPGVIEQLRRSLPLHWSASKVAVDGDCIAHVIGQIKDLPTSTTDLIVSVGGNDARRHTGLLAELKGETDLEAALEQPLAEFRQAYRQMLSVLVATDLDLHVCTIYTAVPFADPVWRRYVPLAITRFNAVITSEAAEQGVPVLKLHEVCVEDSDFSKVSPIEPSCQGGWKIVDHILANQGVPNRAP